MQYLVKLASFAFLAVSLCITNSAFSGIQKAVNIFSEEVPVGSWPSKFIPYFDELNEKQYFFFTAYTLDDGYEVWVTDGSEGGTHKFYSFIPGVKPSTDTYSLSVVGSYLIVKIVSGDKIEQVYQLLLDGSVPYPPSSINFIFQDDSYAVNRLGKLYTADDRFFLAPSFDKDLINTANGLFASPSEGGFYHSLDALINAGYFQFDTSRSVFSLDNDLFFNANHNYKNGFFKTTEDGIEKLSSGLIDFELGSNEDYVLLARSMGPYTSKANLWTLNRSTFALAQLGTDVTIYGERANNYRDNELNNKLYFSARSLFTGSELGVSDGTSEGTYIIDLTPGTEGTRLDMLGRVGEWMYFQVDASEYIENGIWRTQGTLETSEFVKRLPAPYSIGSMVDIGSENVLSCRGNVYTSNSDLWKINAKDNTFDELDLGFDEYLCGDIRKLPNNEVMLTLSNDQYGPELWKLNAKLEPELLKEIEPGTMDLADNTRPLKHHKDLLILRQFGKYGDYLTVAPKNKSNMGVTAFDSGSRIVGDLDYLEETDGVYFVNFAEDLHFYHVTSDGVDFQSYEFPHNSRKRRWLGTGGRHIVFSSELFDRNLDQTVIRRTRTQKN